MVVFLGKIVCQHPNGLRMLYCWHDTGLMIVLTVSSRDNHFYRCPKESEGGFIKENNFSQPSAVQSLHFLQNVSLSLRVFFFWREEISFFGHFPKVFDSLYFPTHILVGNFCF